MNRGWLAGGAMLLLVAPFLGSGLVNGDIAVYLTQAASWSLSARWVHALYVLLLTPWPTPLWADLLSAGCAATTVGLVVHQAGWRSGALLAGAVLPWAAFGEVDAVWLLGAAVALVGGPFLGAVGLGLAVAISPTALILVPWVFTQRPDRRWVGALVAVLALTAISRGDWWVGQRGVLAVGFAVRPLQALGWLVGPALFALWDGRMRRSDLWLLPVLGAPSDVPAWWALVLVWSVRPGRGEGRWLWGLPLLAGFSGLVVASSTVRADMARLQAVANEPQGTVAGWTDQQRLAWIRADRAPPGR